MPASGHQLNILLSFAQFEREVIGERSCCSTIWRDAGIRLRGILAMSDPRLLPSACHDGIGTPDCIAFAAQYLAYTRPCQRFAYCLAAVSRA